ncbi:MAG: type II toxin-antitoxin system prevent-host-death family antitoxin [Zoogloeaceae bacterium]|nr:type II toxin-antitoxin system prevent-host-death family antitoxin [Zoogloeaceae bacterium]
MRTVPVYEAKTKFSELLAAVEHGEQVTITRRGRAVARIVAAVYVEESAQAQRQRVAGTFARLRELRQGVSLGMDLHETIEEGRD